MDSYLWGVTNTGAYSTIDRWENYSWVLTNHNFSSVIDLPPFAAISSCVRHWNLTIIYIRVTIQVLTESARLKVTMADRYRRTSLIDQSDLKQVNKLHGFVFSFHFTKVLQIWLNIYSISDLQMDENQSQSNLNSDFHALFMSSSSCLDVRNIWMKDVSMGKCCLSIPIRAFQLIFSFRFRKKSSWKVFVIGMIHLLK